jgi:hypothetical protein
VISYAPHHVEQDIPKRPVRRRMGAPRTPPTGPEAARTAEAPQPTRRPGRRVIRSKERLSMAHAPARFPALENGVPLLQGLAASTAPGRGCTGRYGGGCRSISAEIPSPTLVNTCAWPLSLSLGAGHLRLPSWNVSVDYPPHTNTLFVRRVRES